MERFIDPCTYYSIPLITEALGRGSKAAVPPAQRDSPSPIRVCA